MTILEKKIKYTFKDKALLKEALTHKSVFRSEPLKSSSHLEEKKKKKSESAKKDKKKSNGRSHENEKDNERLEFLGDAVLSLSTAFTLMKKFPQMNEGDLSKSRSSLVNEKALSKLALKLKLDSFLYLGKEAKEAQFYKNPRLQASAFEALIGAYFLDSDFSHVHSFIETLFKPLMKKSYFQEQLSQDFKSSLQEYYQKNNQGPPEYVIFREEGPDHNKTFFVKVFVNQTFLATGKGANKKEAEQNAAKLALKKIKIIKK